MFFWSSLAFSMIQWMLTIWSLVPLPFLKSSLNIWKFTVLVLLKPGLENFKRYLARVWDECNCAVVWTFFVIVFLGTGMKTDLFKSYGYCWVSQICWHTECTTFTATNKASGGDGIPVELFQILKNDAVKVLHSVCQQILKTQQWPQDWKRSVFIPIPK